MKLVSLLSKIALKKCPNTFFLKLDSNPRPLVSLQTMDWNALKGFFMNVLANIADGLKELRGSWNCFQKHILSLCLPTASAASNEK